MASKSRLTPVSSKELKKIAGLATPGLLEARFPPSGRGGTDARAALRNWQDQQPAPEAPRNPEVTVRAVEPTSAAISRLVRVVESGAPTAELVIQRLDEESFTGTVFSAVAAYEYMLLEGELKKRVASPRTRADAEAQWPKIVSAFQDAFAAVGLPGVTQAQLARYAKQLAANSKNLETVAGIVNSAAPGTRIYEKTPAAVTASFIPESAKIADPAPVAFFIPNLCQVPLAQGTFTKHFGATFSFRVTISVPCPTWKNPFRFCAKTFTLASVGFNADVNVGYKVTCCGGSAFGQAAVQACGSILGVKKCASCSASIVGIAGISSVPVGSGCEYGLGIDARLECKVGGSTVFSASQPFGIAINGPCPPLPC